MAQMVRKPIYISKSKEHHLKWWPKLGMLVRPRSSAKHWKMSYSAQDIIPRMIMKPGNGLRRHCEKWMTYLLCPKESVIGNVKTCMRSG